MRIGVFADIHDHLDNLRAAVERFNQEEVEAVLFAGDLVSTFTVPPLRKLNCPFVGCFGDNEGNRIGIYGGMSIIGTIGEPPFCYRAPDGTRILLTHAFAWTKGFQGEFDVLVYAHTHRPAVHKDEQGRLFVNPGETSGWSYRNPSIAILDTTRLDAEIIPLTTGGATETNPLPRMSARQLSNTEATESSPDSSASVGDASGSDASGSAASLRTTDDREVPS